MKEADLYPVLQQYFVDRGYNVQAEVNDVDLVATKDDTMIVVEMKTQFSVKLLYQACQRQKVCDNVYVAIPPITNRKSVKERKHVLRRLNIGLLFVDIENNTVEAILDPTEFVFRRSKKKKQRLLTELDRRVTNYNVGGVIGKKVITAYRENVIKVAYSLLDGPLSIKELKVMTGIKTVGAIVQKNYYQWFERVERGVYQLADVGKKELSGYKELFIELGLEEDS